MYFPVRKISFAAGIESTIIAIFAHDNYFEGCCKKLIANLKASLAIAIQRGNARIISHSLNCYSSIAPRIPDFTSNIGYPPLPPSPHQNGRVGVV